MHMSKPLSLFFLRFFPSDVCSSRSRLFLTDGTLASGAEARRSADVVGASTPDGFKKPVDVGVRFEPCVLCVSDDEASVRNEAGGRFPISSRMSCCTVLFLEPLVNLGFALDVRGALKPDIDVSRFVDCCVS